MQNETSMTSWSQGSMKNVYFLDNRLHFQVKCYQKD